MGELLAEATGSGRVIGLGATAAPADVDPKAAKKARKALKASEAELEGIFQEIGLSEAQAKTATRGREVAA
jgi:hypothetical protein